MANGAAVLQLVHTEAPEPAHSGEIERAIGEATAAAASALAKGMFEFGWDGGLTVPTKEAGASKIAALYKLQQATPAGIDFAAVARQEGRRTLWARHGANLPESVLNEVISGVLEIVDRVSALMRLTAY